MPRRQAAKPIGVTNVRRGAKPEAPTKRAISAHEAAENSPLFGSRSGKGGGAGFARWVYVEHGITSSTRRPDEQWQPLLKEFAVRPIHGHRRGPTGSNHRPSR